MPSDPFASHLDPALTLLLAVSRRRPDPALAAQAIAAGVDWHRFAKLAVLHRVAPLARRGLDLVAGPTTLDRHPGLATLTAAAARNGLHALVLARETSRIVAELAAAGVSVLVLKGSIEGVCSWGDVALRPALDIDLFVAPAQARPAAEILLAHGLAPTRPGLMPAVGASWLNPAEIPFRHPDANITVELHWRFASPSALFPQPVQSMLEQAVFIPLASSGIPTLPFPERFLYLCAHGGSHGWTKLAWLCDITENLHQMAGNDAEAIVQRAREWGMMRLLSIPCHMAHQLLGAPLPRALPSPDMLARWLTRRFTAPLIAAPDRVPRRGYRGPWRKLTDNVTASTGWRSRAAVLLATLSPGPVDLDGNEPDGSGLTGLSPSAVAFRRLVRLLRHGPKPIDP